MMPVHTFSGRSLYPLAPTPEAIDIEDIAHALSQLCRFVGQVGAFYSVAQHSVLCSHLCEPGDALAALLHDAAEAYIGDVPRPVRRMTGMERFNAIEAHLTTVILQRFGLAGRLPASVLLADDALCLHEAHDLFPSPPEWARDVPHPMTRLRIQPWTAAAARATFLRRFEFLGGVREAAS